MKKIAPASWYTMPNWFSENQWLIENQEHRFVKSLANLIIEIHVNMKMRKPSFLKSKNGSKPYLHVLKSYFEEALKSSQSFTGNDYEVAKEVIAKVKANFDNHMPFLKTA